MVQSRAEEGRKYRAKKASPEWTAEQSRRRKVRRAAKRAAAVEPIESEEKEDSGRQSPLLSVEPSPDFCGQLVDRIFEAKLAMLREAGKTIKRKTVERQVRNVRNLYHRLTNPVPFGECVDLKFLKDTGKIVHMINRNFKTPNSRNTQYQSIASVLAALPKFRKEYLFYSKLSTVGRKKINKVAGENKMSAAEAENFMPWKELAKVLGRVKDPRDKAIIGLYTRMPVRRVEDVSRIRIMPHGISRNTPIFMANNWMTFDRSNFPRKIIYNVHKTSKTAGPVTLEIPVILSAILRSYVEAAGLKPNDVLFGTRDGTVHRNFSEVLTKAFAPYVEKKVTVDMLRHSFVQFKLSRKLTVNQKKLLARQMGHSVATQSMYDRVDN